MATVRQRHRERESQTWQTAGGDVLTAANVEALASEAEAGYDLSKARIMHVGHPSLDAGVSPRVTFRAGAGLYTQIRARAAEEHRSISDLARDAVTQYMEHSAG